MPVSRWKYFNRVKHSLNFKHFHCRKICVLGIESSCDDTGAAVVNDSKTILGEALQSQYRIHVEMGGVVANVARNLHKKHLKNIVESSMKQSQLDFKDLDAIAVTVKPGLPLSLDEGIEYAKTLCRLYKKPLIPIHHMEAHALTVRLTEDVKFPFLTFLVSGGHCILALCKSVTEYYRLGESLDHSPGQAFDRTSRRAKLSNLKKLRGLVGGAAIEVAATEGNPTAIAFASDTMTKLKNCNFSFSGFIATALRHITEQEQRLGLQPDEVIPDVYDLCSSFQWAIAKHLCRRLEICFLYIHKKNLLKDDEKSLVLSGGVASNHFVRSALKFVCDHYNYRLLAPPQRLCTDNGVMIAWNGIERLKANCPVVKFEDLHTVLRSMKCPLGEDISSDVHKELENFNLKKEKMKLNNFIKFYKNEVDSRQTENHAEINKTESLS